VRYVALALWSEGPTDQRFLRPVLHRLTEDLVHRFGDEPVQVAEEFVELVYSSQHGASRAERIAAAVGRVAGAITVLFVHADGGRDPDRARADRVAPAFREVRRRVGEAAPTCAAVVPVRETESWSLADPEAIRRALALPRIPTLPELPARAREVERLTDPKQSLRRVIETLAGRPRGRRRSTAERLAAIGGFVSLERLRQVPAFHDLEVDLRAALTVTGCLPARPP
jgi:hypothetical protein